MPGMTTSVMTRSNSSLIARGFFQAAFAAVGFQHLVSPAVKSVAHQLANRLFIFHQQNRLRPAQGRSGAGVACFSAAPSTSRQIDVERSAAILVRSGP